MKTLIGAVLILSCFVDLVFTHGTRYFHDYPEEVLAYQTGRVREEAEIERNQVEAMPSGRKVPEERFVAGEVLTLSIPADSSSILNGIYPIDAEGYADLPILGKVYVVDKNRKELQEFIKAQLADYMKDTHITARPAIRISFLGYFRQQGLFYAHPDMMVWDAFRFSGGAAGEKEVENMTVMRGSETLVIKPLDVFSAGLTLREAGIISGDIFVLPVPEEKKGFWYYFKDTVGIFASLLGITMSSLTIMLILENGTIPGRL